MFNHTLGGALDHWILAQGLNKKPRTREYHAEIVGIIRDNWGDVNAPVSAITSNDVLTFAQKVAHYSPSRWNAIVSVMRAITPEARVLKRRRMRFKEFRPPNQLQFAALLAECDRMPRSHAGLVIRFLSLTGMRIKEAMALTWLDVFDDRIEVRADTTKNGKTRSLPIIGSLPQLLERLRRIDSGGYVLPRGNVKKSIARACARAGIDHLTHHDFRHLFATRCIESGVDLPTVARWLGHRDGGGLLSKCYFHLLDEHSRNMAARVRIAA